MVPLSMTLVDC